MDHEFFILCVTICQVPQQWIGSSVALAAEVGSFSVEPKVLVKVFDWGRAELNTREEYMHLPLPERESRAHYWRPKLWVGGFFFSERWSWHNRAYIICLVLQ